MLFSFRIRYDTIGHVHEEYVIAEKTFNISARSIDEHNIVYSYFLFLLFFSVVQSIRSKFSEKVIILMLRVRQDTFTPYTRNIPTRYRYLIFVWFRQ